MTRSSGYWDKHAYSQVVIRKRGHTYL